MKFTCWLPGLARSSVLLGAEMSSPLPVFHLPIFIRVSICMREEHYGAAE